MPMYGPTKGTLRAKPAIVPRKSPKRMKMPYSSTRKPISGHRSRISARPAKKAAVPFALFRRAKKSSVLAGPIMIVRPIRKRIYISRPRRTSVRMLEAGGREAVGLVGGGGRTFPIASIARSKNSSTPPIRKKPPVSGTQQLVYGHGSLAGQTPAVRTYRQSRRRLRFLERDG